jgi:hypothetical protein
MSPFGLHCKWWLPMPANNLTDTLFRLGIEPHELAASCRVEVETVEQWMKAKSLGGEAAVLLRPIFASDESALAAVEKVRRTFHRNYADGDRGALNISTTTVGPPVRDGAHYGSAA